MESAHTQPVSLAATERAITYTKAQDIYVRRQTNQRIFNFQLSNGSMILLFTPASIRILSWGTTDMPMGKSYKNSMEEHR